MKVIAILLGTTLPGCASTPNSAAAPRAETSDPCYDADIAAKRVWNEETRITINARVLQWGGELGVDVAQQRAQDITNSMDRLTDDWARMRKAVRRDHFVRETLSKDEYQRRADCLDRLLARQRTFLDSLTTPNSDITAQLQNINRELVTCQ